MQEVYATGPVLRPVVPTIRRASARTSSLTSCSVRSVYSTTSYASSSSTRCSATALVVLEANIFQQFRHFLVGTPNVDARKHREVEPVEAGDQQFTGGIDQLGRRDLTDAPERGGLLHPGKCLIVHPPIVDHRPVRSTHFPSDFGHDPHAWCTDLPGAGAHYRLAELAAALQESVTSCSADGVMSNYSGRAFDQAELCGD